MALTNQDKKLLNEIFSASLKSTNGLDAVRFRADKAQFIPELDQLQLYGYLLREDNLYSISLIALIHIAKENPDAQSLLDNCGLVFTLLKSNYMENLGKRITTIDIAGKIGVSENDVSVIVKYLSQTPINGGYSSNSAKRIESTSPSESILKYNSFEDVLREQEEWDKRNQIHQSEKHSQIGPKYSLGQEPSLSATLSKTNWETIEAELDINKISFGRKINFIKVPFKRTIIFRDTEQAFTLASSGFSKPAVILAGSVIEELLRLYLEYKQIKPIKDDFNGYIQTCEQHKLLKDSVSRLSHSVRGFRNLVHLSAEETKKHTISKATAIGAVSSIFTIANDF